MKLSDQNNFLAKHFVIFFVLHCDGGGVVVVCVCLFFYQCLTML